MTPASVRRPPARFSPPVGALLVLIGSGSAYAVDETTSALVDRITHSVECAVAAAALGEDEALATYLARARDGVLKVQDELQGCPSSSLTIVGSEGRSTEWVSMVPTFGMGAEFCLGRLFEERSAYFERGFTPTSHVDHEEMFKRRIEAATSVLNAPGCRPLAGDE
ncbi:MAG: hypothetical protein AAFU80_05265 [Pseudomonadota bacterium]